MPDVVSITTTLETVTTQVPSYSQIEEVSTSHVAMSHVESELNRISERLNNLENDLANDLITPKVGGRCSDIRRHGLVIDIEIRRSRRPDLEQ